MHIEYISFILLPNTEVVVAVTRSIKETELEPRTSKHH